MAKIQNVGIGNYIRNPRGTRGDDARQSNIAVMKVVENCGNAFLCYPVKDPKTVPVTLDTTQYQFIPIDQEVDIVTL